MRQTLDGVARLGNLVVEIDANAIVTSSLLCVRSVAKTSSMRKLLGITQRCKPVKESTEGHSSF